MSIDIVKRSTLAVIAENYKTAIMEVECALEVINAVKQRMNAVLGQDDFRVVPGGRHGRMYDLPEFEMCRTEMKGQVWRAIVNRAKVYEVCSVAQRKEIEGMLYDHPETLPEISEDALFDWLQSFVAKTGSLFEDCVKEIFNWLRPRDERYKTNNRYVIGDRVVLTWMFDRSWGGYPHLRYDQEKWVMALDNVFHLADGKGGAKEPTLVQVIHTAEKTGRECTTEYFKCRWYKNGNMHIEFLRMDLVEKINAIAGGMNLAA